MKDLYIDRSLPVPLVSQLTGQIEYGIAFGDIGPGSKMPSVRDLAERLQISPVTVLQVYKGLRHKGILVTQPGKGTFVSDDVTVSDRPTRQLLMLYELIHRLTLTARDLGIGDAELARLLSVRLGQQRSGNALDLVLVGNFAPATTSYAADLRRYLHVDDVLEGVTFADLRTSVALRRRVGEADAVVTLAYRLKEVRDIVGDEMPLLTIHFLPSEATRMAVAELDPLQRVGLVSTYSDFLLTFKQAIESFAPHLTIAHAFVLGDEEGAAKLGDCDVVIYATGAEEICERLPPHLRTIEYRYAPDPRSIAHDLLPFIDRLRQQRLSGTVTT